MRRLHLLLLLIFVAALSVISFVGTFLPHQMMMSSMMGGGFGEMSVAIVAVAYVIAFPTIRYATPGQQRITIPTAVMFPILVLMYYRLAKKEEEEMERLFGDEYGRYRLSVPMFLPTGLFKATNHSLLSSKQPLGFRGLEDPATSR